MRARYADRRCVIGHGIQHHGTRRHTGVITHAERPQHLCARTDEHVISKRRVTLALVFARAAERHTLIQCAVVTDNGGFADDDTHTVVDEQIFTDRRARVNLYTRFAARALPRYSAR